MSETTEQKPAHKTIAGGILEIALWSLLIGAVLYAVAWRGDTPLRWIVTAHVILTLIVAVAVVVLGEKPFETLVLVVILTAMSCFALPAYHDYSVRSSVRDALLVGKAVSEALDRAGPKPVEQLGVTIPPQTISRVTIESKDAFRLTLAEPPLSGKELVFSASSVKGVRTWRCRSKEIKEPYLPRSCRD